MCSSRPWGIQSPALQTCLSGQREPRHWNQALVECSLNAVTFLHWGAKESPALRFFYSSVLSWRHFLCLLHPSGLLWEGYIIPWGCYCRQVDLAEFREGTVSMRSEDVFPGLLVAHHQHRKGFAGRQSIYTLAQLPLAVNCPAKSLPRGSSAFSMPWPLVWTQKKFFDLSSHISQKKRRQRGECSIPCCRL